MTSETTNNEFAYLLLDDGLLRNKREEALVKYTKEKAIVAGESRPVALLVARTFIRNYMMNPALLRSETIEADKSNPNSYDPLEFAAPTNCDMSTFEESEIPRLVDVNEITFDKQNVRGGFNGMGTKATYRGGKYFVKKNSSQADVIARSDRETNIAPPRNGALQEVLYINLFHRSKKLVKHVPKSCCFVAPKNVLLISDLYEATYYVRPSKIDVLEEIEANRLIIWMDELPTENSFSRLPILDKLKHYRDTILEFHRFAAVEGVSMRDDKADGYCVDNYGLLKRFDFGGCANFNHKKQDLPREMTYNILENLYGGVYSTPNSKDPRLGELNEFNFHKITRDRGTKLESNPKGLLLWLASINLAGGNPTPNDVITTIDGVLEKLEYAKALNKKERALLYKKFSKTRITHENFDTLVALLETEESETELAILLDVHRNSINELLTEKFIPEEKLKEPTISAVISFGNMFEESIDWNGLVDLWEETVDQKLDEASRRSISRAIGLLRRSSGCSNMNELISKNWEDIFKILPEQAQASDILVAKRIFDELKKSQV